eukprot:1469244-Prymnesium_polylepis.1
MQLTARYVEAASLHRTCCLCDVAAVQRDFPPSNSYCATESYAYRLNHSSSFRQCQTACIDIHGTSVDVRS